MNAAEPILQDHELINALQQRLQASNISGTALVFTFFCDVVTRHGGEVWLGSVIHALEPLGINARSVRTAVFRLVKNDWLSSRKQGRRSYYRLSDLGRRHYLRAAKRIYANDKPDWGGKWMLLFVAMVPEEKREALHRGLSWLGYGRLATAVYALPGEDQNPLKDLLADLDIEDNIVHMQAKAEGSESLKDLVLSRWQLEDLQTRYVEFTDWLCQIRMILKSNDPNSPQSLLLLRVLVIHEYRRILLTDPELPTGMLPSDWPGEAATNQTAALYCQLYADSANWFENQLQMDDQMPTVDIGNYEPRFASTKVK